MSRARDDRRRNNRRNFALYRDDDDRTLVGSFWMGEADGCSTGYLEDGTPFEHSFSESHEPGSHVLNVVKSPGGVGRLVAAEAVVR